MKFCRYRDCRCFHDGHCGLIDCSGSVFCCSFHPRPFAFFMRRKVVGFHPSFSELLGWKGGS